MNKGDVGDGINSEQRWAGVSSHDQQTMMDDSREDLPRISLDSLRDWHRIKSRFSKAVLEQFDQSIRQNGLESERASLLPHVRQVRINWIHCPSKPASPHRTSSSQFIDTTFEKAKPNVRINGKNFEDLKDEDDGTSSTRLWHQGF